MSHAFKKKKSRVGKKFQATIPNLLTESQRLHELQDLRQLQTNPQIPSGLTELRTEVDRTAQRIFEESLSIPPTQASEPPPDFDYESFVRKPRTSYDNDMRRRKAAQNRRKTRRRRGRVSYKEFCVSDWSDEMFEFEEERGGKVKKRKTRGQAATAAKRLETKSRPTRKLKRRLGRASAAPTRDVIDLTATSIETPSSMETYPSLSSLNGHHWPVDLGIAPVYNLQPNNPHPLGPLSNVLNNASRLGAPPSVNPYMAPFTPSSKQPTIPLGKLDGFRTDRKTSKAIPVILLD